MSLQARRSLGCVSGPLTPEPGAAAAAAPFEDEDDEDDVPAAGGRPRLAGAGTEPGSGMPASTAARSACSPSSTPSS